MGEADYLALGDWNAACYECGFKYKASQLKKHWQGYWVCSKCWEPRQPQDFVREVQDVQTPPWVQPLPPEQFVFATDLLITESSDAEFGPMDYITTEDGYPLTTET